MQVKEEVSNDGDNRDLLDSKQVGRGCRCK
jgi:hypothetical protein